MDNRLRPKHTGSGKQVNCRLTAKQDEMIISICAKQGCLKPEVVRLAIDDYVEKYFQDEEKKS